MKNLLIVAASAFVLSACASTSGPSTTAAQNPAAEKEYRTGSRIPVRDPVSPSPTKIVEPSAVGAAPRAM
jgi:heat shock protein HslJ